MSALEEYIARGKWTEMFVPARQIGSRQIQFHNVGVSPFSRKCASGTGVLASGTWSEATNFVPRDSGGKFF